MAALLSIPSAASAGEGRWPAWPTEIERIAAPLLSVERPSHDRDRAAAIVRLEEYATPVIEPLVIEALKAMVAAGATRIGASAGVRIVQESKGGPKGPAGTGY